MAWSFSALKAYETCAYRRRLKLNGIVEQENEHILKGHAYHTAAEQMLKTGQADPLIPESWAEVINEARGKNHIAEILWGLDSNWQPTKKDAWCWVKLDLCIQDDDRVQVVDYKSGKKHPVSHIQQANLYLIAAAAYYPNAKTYQAKFLYLDDSPLITKAFSPESIEPFKLSYERRATKMLEDKALLPRPHKTNCKYCGYNIHCPYSAYEDAA